MALRRNIYFSLFSHWTGVALALVTTVFVSRLLTPHEVGIFAISLSVVGLVQILQQFGTNEYIVQRKDLDEEARRAAFGVSLAAGLATSILIVLASVPVARFYETEELQTVMWILAANPILNTITTPISSMFQRERMFLKLGIINVASAAVNTVTAVTLSYLGFSYLSLAIALTASTIVTVVGRLVLGRQFSLWRPSFGGSRRVFSFGLKVHLANLFSYIQFSTTELIVGKALGLSAAAIFHRATIINQIFSRLVTNSLNPVLTAEYAALNRSGGSVASSFLGSTRYLSALAWPFFGFMALYAAEVIQVLFGSQWTAAVLPMQVLCIGAAFWPMNGPAMSVLVGLGAVNLNLVIRSFTMTVRLGLTIVASFYSLEAVAVAVVASAGVTFVLTSLGVYRKTHFTLRDFVMSLVPSGLVAIVALAPAAMVQWLFRDTGVPDVIVVLVGGLAAGFGWLAGLRLTMHPLWNEAALLTRRAADVLIPPIRRRVALPGGDVPVGRSE
jgi:O-antigen/teichoic acid export membrane protein